MGFKGSAFTEAKFKCAKGLYDKFKKKNSKAEGRVMSF